MLVACNRKHLGASFLIVCFVVLGPLHPRDHFVTAGEIALHTEASPKPQPSHRHLHEHEHQQQNQRGAEQFIAVDNECSLCQGLTTLDRDFPEANVTCSDFANLWKDNYKGIGNQCRSDVLFNLGFDLCCKPSVPLYRCETNVHDLIFGGDYNSAIPPFIDPENPLVISVDITYQSQMDIDTAEGTAAVFLTLILTWVDPRLKWDVQDFDTCSNMVDVFTGSDVETTQIWMPDFDVLNVVEGIASLPDKKAAVYSNGVVRWTISGGLKVFCSMKGLANIPYDTLGCQLLFGPTSRGISPNLKFELVNPDEFSVGAFKVTYNEWIAVPEKMKKGMIGDQLMFLNVFFQRAKNFYVNDIVIPTIILTYLSFFTFLLDMRVGERLGFGMALALVIVAQQIITSDKLPISDQKLFLGKLVGWSFYWVLLSLVQSAVVGFLYYLREDRQAKKENKNIDRMSLAERSAMMERAHEEELALTGAPPESFSWEAEKESCFYTFSFRKFDMCCLVFATISYTVFLVWMFASVQETDWWLKDEPTWFDENFEIEHQAYNNSDPDS